MSNFSLTRPQMIGNIRETMMYSSLGLGSTDPILFVGHADAEVMYEPYQVLNIKKAINFLNADSNSPLLKAMLEAYNAGSRDIWIYPAAPMNEYEPFISLRLEERSGWDNKNFYQKYYERLETAYPRMLTRDQYRVITPLEAPHYYDGYLTSPVDFTSQLIDFCSTFYSTTGSVCLGVIGTKLSQVNTNVIQEMVSDERLELPSSNSKFVMIAMGETLNFLPQLTFSYQQLVSTQVAILLSLLPLDRSVVGIKLPGAISLSGRNLSDEEMAVLSSNKINAASRSQRGKRGVPYQVNLLTDNTLAKDNSDYWSMGPMRAVATCINEIRRLGYQYIGEIRGFSLLKDAIYNYLNVLSMNKLINSYSFDIKGNYNYTKAYVDVSIMPLYSIKSIYFTVEVGPGE